MADKHVLKLTTSEVVIKCYTAAACGAVLDISLQNDLVAAGQEFIGYAKANVAIQEIYWGTKNNKQLDVVRVVNAAANTIDGYYYLTNSGYYDFVGFVDNAYSNGNIRLISDGPFHCILKLRKTGGYTGV